MEKPIMPFYTVLVIGSISVIAFLMALLASVTFDNAVSRVTSQEVLSEQVVRE